MADYKLPFSGNEILNKLNNIDTLENNVTELKSDLSNLKETTIEGYTQKEVYIDCIVEAEKTSGAYCYNGYVDNVLMMLSVNISTYNWYKLPVFEGEKYHIKTIISDTPRAYYFVKNDGRYISRFPNESQTEYTIIDEIVTIPSGVEALYVNQFINTSQEFIFERKSNYIEYKKNDVFYSFDSLYGKRLACVGDSITEATNPNGGYFKNYAEIVAERHNMKLYKDGIGGSTISNISGHNAFSDKRYLNVTEYDILTIWFGWNDASYSTVGTIDDETDTTFYGAYNKVLSHFISTYPTKKIGLIVPYGGTNVEPFRQAIRNLSNKFGVPCLDLNNYNECSCIWGVDNDSQLARRSALTYDTTHPNQDGHIYLSSMYEEFIKRL